MAATKSIAVDALLDQAKQAAFEKLRKKLDAGEELSSAELDRLGRWTKALEKRAGGDLVRSKTALADAIPCARTTLDRYWNKTGHPKRSTDGRYSVNAWRQFITTVSEIELTQSPDVGTSEESGGGEETNREKALKLRKLLADAEKAETDAQSAKHDLEERQGKFIDKDAARADVIRCNEAVKQELLRRFQQTAPADYEACAGDPVQCREINRKHLLAAFEFMHSGEW